MTMSENRLSSFGVAHWRRTGSVVATAILAIAFAAGCSSSGSSSSPPSSSTNTGASGATAGGSANGSDSATGGVAAAQAAVTTAKTTPTKIDQTVPLKSKPATGKTVVFIQCELASCVDIGNGVKAGAAALGWNFKELSFKTSDPTTLISAMKQALQYKPYAVSFSGEAEPVWASEISSYKSAGVFIIPVVIGPLTTTSTIAANIGDFTAGGVTLGNWFINDSGGTGHALLVDVPTFPVLTEYINGMKQAISKNCPACKTTTLDGTLSQIGSSQFVPAIVTALKKDTSIKYVLCSDDIFIAGLSSALKAAGLSNVKIAGGQPEPADLQGIQSGSEAAAALISNPILGWMVDDSLARLSEGMTVPAGDGGAPQQLLVKDNVTSTDLNTYVTPTDYPSQFKTLWQVG